MKVEATCTDQECITFGTMQLISVTKVGESTAYDDEGNPIECKWCGACLHVTRLSSDAAQFPLGTVILTSMAKGHLDDTDGEDPLAAQKRAAEFVACHVAYEPGTGLPNTFGDAIQLPDGSIVTQHVWMGEYVWVKTNPTRTETLVMMAREHNA